MSGAVGLGLGALAAAALAGSVVASTAAVVAGANAVATVAATSGFVAAAGQIGSNFKAAGQQIVQAVSSVFGGGSQPMSNAANTTSEAAATTTSTTTSTALSTNFAYPPNNGFAGNAYRMTSKVGEVWQRIGYEGGHYLSDIGAHPSSISLSFEKWGNPVHYYQTIKEFDYIGGIAAPFYGLPGGAYQAYVEQTVAWLLDPSNGYLKEIFF